MARFERAGSCLRQYRRVEHEVFRRDDRRASLAEKTCDVAAREPSAQHERSSERLASGHAPTLRCELHGDMDRVAVRIREVGAALTPGLVHRLTQFPGPELL